MPRLWIDCFCKVFPQEVFNKFAPNSINRWFDWLLEVQQHMKAIRLFLFPKSYEMWAMFFLFGLLQIVFRWTLISPRAAKKVISTLHYLLYYDVVLVWVFFSFWGYDNARFTSVRRHYPGIHFRYCTMSYVSLGPNLYHSFPSVV